MAITAVKVGDKRFVAPGYTEVEYSITFDTNYATTGGETLPFNGSNTNFTDYVRYMKVTKFPRFTNYVLMPELSRGTNDAPTNAKIMLFRHYLTSSTNVLVKCIEVSNTTDLTNCTMRAIFGGY